MTQLVLLKNKLLKYRDENVFAQNAKEIHTLRSAIRANLTNILDISSASDILQKEIIKYIYDSIDEMDLFVYSFVPLNNDNADKKLIRHFLTKNKIYTTIACSHNFKYLYELKERAGNLILFAPQTLQHDFASYNTFLNKLNTDEFIIYGKATQHVPLIIELTSILEREDEQTQDVPQEHTNIQTEPEEEQVTTEEPDDFSDESNSYSYETLISDDTPVQQEQEESETEDNIEESQTQEEIQPQVISDIIDKEIAEEKEPAPLPEIIEEAPENYSEDLPDVFKNPPDETLLQEAPIEIEEEVPPPVSESFIDGNIIEESEEPPAPVINYDDTSLPIISENELHEKTEEANITPAIQDNAAEVVDEIMFSKPNVDIPPIDEEFDEEALTEDDLNFIEDVNIGTPEIAEEVNVPVYPAETPVKAEIPVFEQGDRVTHPKYGEGVVEKMIKYGNKTLCSINFVNIGRRLLDPAISEIEKV